MALIQGSHPRSWPRDSLSSLCLGKEAACGKLRRTHPGSAPEQRCHPGTALGLRNTSNYTQPLHDTSALKAPQEALTLPASLHTFPMEKRRQKEHDCLQGQPWSLWQIEVGKPWNPVSQHSEHFSRPHAIHLPQAKLMPGSKETCPWCHLCKTLTTRLLKAVWQLNPHCCRSGGPRHLPTSHKSGLVFLHILQTPAALKTTRPLLSPNKAPRQPCTVHTKVGRANI